MSLLLAGVSSLLDHMIQTARNNINEFHRRNRITYHQKSNNSSNTNNGRGRQSNDLAIREIRREEDNQRRQQRRHLHKQRYYRHHNTDGGHDNNDGEGDYSNGKMKWGRREILRKVKAQLRVGEVAYRRIEAARRMLRGTRRQGAEKVDSSNGGEEGLALKDVAEGNRDLKGCIVALAECVEEEIDRRRKLERLLVLERQMSGRYRKDHSMPMGMITGAWGTKKTDGLAGDDTLGRRNVKYVPRANTWTPGIRVRRGTGSIVGFVDKGREDDAGHAKVQRSNSARYTTPTDNTNRRSRSFGGVSFSGVVTELGRKNLNVFNTENDGDKATSNTKLTNGTGKAPGGAVAGGGNRGVISGRKLRSSLKQARARPADTTVHWDLPAKA